MKQTGNKKLSGTKLYYVWNSIKTRCYNSKSLDFKNYGGRGIVMCEEWKNSSKCFCEWAYENGYEEGLTIERKDNEGNYCPENCIWITKAQQVNNRRNNILYTYQGKTQNLSQWCRELNLDYSLMHNRIRMKNWDFERAILTPVCASKRNRKAKNYGRIYKE